MMFHCANISKVLSIVAIKPVNKCSSAVFYDVVLLVWMTEIKGGLHLMCTIMGTTTTGAKWYSLLVDKWAVPSDEEVWKNEASSETETYHKYWNIHPNAPASYTHAQTAVSCDQASVATTESSQCSSGHVWTQRDPRSPSLFSVCWFTTAWNQPALEARLHGDKGGKESDDVAGRTAVPNQPCVSPSAYRRRRGMFVFVLPPKRGLFWLSRT